MLHTTPMVPTSFSPGKQATQTDDPMIDALLVTHVVQAESSSSAAYVPAPQLMHILTKVRATSAEYLPGEQL